MTLFITRLVRNTGRGLALQEALYGFIMAMLFITASAFGLIASESNAAVANLIIGMNFSWGLIDMVIFYFIDVAEQKKHRRIIEGSDLYDDKRKVIKDNLSGTIVDMLDAESEEKVIDIISEAEPESCREVREERWDLFKSAFSSFVITMLTTIPAVVSLLLIEDLDNALMVAGLSSSAFMFFIGYAMGPYLGTKGWISGSLILAMALGITIIATFTGG